MTEELYLYFAHPIKVYGTPEELEVLRAIHKEYPGYKVIDPSDMEVGKSWVSCQNCMKNIMKKIFFPQIDKASLFVIWAPIATCGIECELHYAWQLGKSCVFVSYFAGEIEFEDLTLQDYHRLENTVEVL